MKLILILTFFCVFELSMKSQAADIQNPQVKAQSKANKAIVKKTTRCLPDPKNPKAKCKTRTVITTETAQPKLKSNEYSLSYDADKTKVFATKLHQGLLLSQNCFKSKTPKCQAYTKSLQKLEAKPEDNMKSPFHNNLGAIHCELMGGKGLIAKTHEGNDDDFCLFEDGSMVSSWSAYYKTNPPNQPTSKTK